jgi:hypothetical protein
MWRAFERAGYKATNKISKALARKKKVKLQPAKGLRSKKNRTRGPAKPRKSLKHLPR